MADPVFQEDDLLLFIALGKRASKHWSKAAVGGLNGQPLQYPPPQRPGFVEGLKNVVSDPVGWASDHPAAIAIGAAGGLLGGGITALRYRRQEREAKLRELQTKREGLEKNKTEDQEATASKLAFLLPAAIGAGIGAATGPKGYTGRSAGRGALMGIGTDLGAAGGMAAGGLAGAGAGMGIGHLLNGAQGGHEGVLPGLLAGAGLGLVGGGLGGFHLTRKMLGEHPKVLDDREEAEQQKIRELEAQVAQNQVAGAATKQADFGGAVGDAFQKHVVDPTKGVLKNVVGAPVGDGIRDSLFDGGGGAGGGFSGFMDRNPWAVAPMIGGGLGIGAGLLNESGKKKKNWLGGALTGGLLGAGAGGLAWGAREMFDGADKTPPAAAAVATPSTVPQLEKQESPVGSGFSRLFGGRKPPPSGPSLPSNPGALTEEASTDPVTNVFDQASYTQPQIDYLKNVNLPNEHVTAGLDKSLNRYGGNDALGSQAVAPANAVVQAANKGETNPGLVGQHTAENRKVLDHILTPPRNEALGSLIGGPGMATAPDLAAQHRASLAPAPLPFAAAMGFPAVVTPGNPASQAAGANVQTVAKKLLPWQEAAEQAEQSTPFEDKINPGAPRTAAIQNTAMAHNAMRGGALGAGGYIAGRGVNDLAASMRNGPGNTESARIAGGVLRNAESPGAINRGLLNPRRMLSNTWYGPPIAGAEAAKNLPLVNKAVANLLQSGIPTAPSAVAGAAGPNIWTPTAVQKAMESDKLDPVIKNTLTDIGKGKVHRNLELKSLADNRDLVNHLAKTLPNGNPAANAAAIENMLRGETPLEQMPQSVRNALTGPQGLFPGAGMSQKPALPGVPVQGPVPPPTGPTLTPEESTAHWLKHDRPPPANSSTLPNHYERPGPQIHLNKPGTSSVMPHLGSKPSITRNVISPGLRGGLAGSVFGAVIDPLTSAPRTNINDPNFRGPTSAVDSMLKRLKSPFDGSSAEPMNLSRSEFQLMQQHIGNADAGKAGELFDRMVREGKIRPKE